MLSLPSHPCCLHHDVVRNIQDILLVITGVLFKKGLNYVLTCTAMQHSISNERLHIRSCIYWGIY